SQKHWSRNRGVWQPKGSNTQLSLTIGTSPKIVGPGQPSARGARYLREARLPPPSRSNPIQMSEVWELLRRRLCRRATTVCGSLLLQFPFLRHERIHFTARIRKDLYAFLKHLFQTF